MSAQNTPARPAPIKVPSEEVDEIEREPTAIEVAIAKAEARISAMPHVDAKTALINYMFPLFRKLAKEQGDHGVEIEDLVDDVRDIAERGGGVDDVKTFEAALGQILKLSQLVDQTMLAAGFYTIGADGSMVPTDKVSSELRTAYETVGPETVAVANDIQSAIKAILDDAEDDDDDDDDGNEVDDGTDAPAGVESNGVPRQPSAQGAGGTNADDAPADATVIGPDASTVVAHEQPAGGAPGTGGTDAA